MSDRIVNFGAGPATLPLPVLEQAQRDLVALPGLGISPLEISHRSAWFADVLAETESNLRTLLQAPDEHHIVFCPGGATQQFSMLPMNLLRGRSTPAAYLVTGAWGAKAVREAEKEGPVTVAWTGADSGFVRVPGDREWRIDPDASYVHLTTNETIEGVEWPAPPDVPASVPLVADASSDFLSGPVDVTRFGVVYAGAQKNAGPAGVAIVLVRDDLLDRTPDGLPTMLDYRTFTSSHSLHNTPPVFAIYVVMLVTRWLRDEVGGLVEQGARNHQKASMLYEAIDGSHGFYLGHADPGSRSRMNVTFRLRSAELDTRFVAEAAEHGLAGLKGHRSVGGIRASIYNAMPIDGVEALAAFMDAFASTHG